VSTPTATPLFCVLRWWGRGWRKITAPLPKPEAEAQAPALKSRISAFHVRVVEVKP
jgi:hypothetical protein